jgi:hypothetical protein
MDAQPVPQAQEEEHPERCHGKPEILQPTLFKMKNQLTVPAGQMQITLRNQGKAFHLTHPRRYELDAEELNALRREVVQHSISNALSLETMSVTIALVKVANKIEPGRELAYALGLCKEYMDFTIEDWRNIMARIAMGTRKRYNKFEISDLLDYFVEYAGEKAEVRERIVRNDQNEYQRALERELGEWDGEFLTKEERAAKRAAAARPKTYEDLVNGKTSISAEERAAMAQRDRERRTQNQAQ